MRVVKKPEERKAEMVAAAAKLFAQQGFVRTSVSEIVSAVDPARRRRFAAKTSPTKRSPGRITFTWSAF